MTALEPAPEKSLVEHVYDQIRDAIYEGRLEPGARLVERKLAAELGVSHIPVREALARLSDDGLVERLPRRGCRVARLTVSELEQISDIRVLLEQFVAVRVQERLTPASEAELRRVVAMMLQAAQHHRVQRLLDLDRRFHELLWSLSEHELLIDLASQLRGKINHFLRAATLALEPGALEQHALSHYKLVEAIASGDSEAAKRAMAEHIHIAAERVSRSLADT